MHSNKYRMSGNNSTKSDRNFVPSWYFYHDCMTYYDVPCPEHYNTEQHNVWLANQAKAQETQAKLDAILKAALATDSTTDSTEVAKEVN